MCLPLTSRSRRAWLVSLALASATLVATSARAQDAGQIFGGIDKQVTETVIHNFSGPDGNGPLGSLILVPSGESRTLYGITPGGGSSSGECLAGGCGVVFSIAQSGDQQPWTESVLTEFQAGSGVVPAAGLFPQLVSGQLVLFGTTLYGANGATDGDINSGYGTVFSLNGDTPTTLWEFTDGLDGAFPGSVLASDDAAGVPGALYGAARKGGDGNKGVVFRLGDGGVSNIWTFEGTTDGKQPSSALIADSTGALYGMTFKLGPKGAGTVFKLIPPEADAGSGDAGSEDAGSGWAEQTLWAFTGGDDGQNPEQADALVMDNSGALYGTTVTGGDTIDATCPVGCGVVFKLSPPVSGQTNWTQQTLWRFQGANDGAFPQGGLIMDGNGALYGTANGGGNPSCAGNGIGPGCGVVFKLTPPAAGQSAWTLTTLWEFGGPPTDGANPMGRLTVDETGTLYGATQLGTTLAATVADAGSDAGFGPCSGEPLGITPGCGTAFQLVGTGFGSGSEVPDGGVPDGGQGGGSASGGTSTGGASGTSSGGSSVGGSSTGSASGGVGGTSGGSLAGGSSTGSASGGSGGTTTPPASSSSSCGVAGLMLPGWPGLAALWSAQLRRRRRAPRG